MSLTSRLLLSFLISSGLIAAESVGYFDDTSICADASGLSKCYEKADASWSSCINNNCAGGSDECYNSCNGNASCMKTQCPSLGMDCINACGCVNALNQVDCIASSCWNQVYSCEYQSTVEDIINLCAITDLDEIPFWPPPDDAVSGCSCNIGKVYKKEILIGDQISTCANNMTNLNQMSDNDAISEYADACICCAESAILSTIWDTCPNTKPSLLAADTWYSSMGDFETCGDYLDAYDCAGALGFGAEDAGETTTYYKLGGFPKNGTETLYNTGSLTAPVSGATFTWTFRSNLHVVTAVSTDHVVAAATATDGQSQTGSATQTAASSTHTGTGTARDIPMWTALAFTSILIFTLV
ncbi:uncharacterized protein N7484_000455 [Penicillium longicatenatum]|uniref:uncharacterized protein n=1 Tax=Penicillium longicatenatum TaxID=1561947 RepID=UPI0025493C9C|nr:uncharacterized protein N7484_000455 [Penicillium longicatenatum]KAJ5661083.1 hypothetical protein N7484_000455 [Penicillium longicatenatum]